MLIWIGLIVLVGVLAAVIAWWNWRDHDTDLGLVSHQWIAEQRFGHERNSQR